MHACIRGTPGAFEVVLNHLSLSTSSLSHSPNTHTPKAESPTLHLLVSPEKKLISIAPKHSKQPKNSSFHLPRHLLIYNKNTNTMTLHVRISSSSADSSATGRRQNSRGSDFVSHTGRHGNAWLCGNFSFRNLICWRKPHGQRGGHRACNQGRGGTG